MFKLKGTSKFKADYRVKSAFVFNGRSYPVGHLFKIIGSDPMRGDDIEDRDGNKIYETRMMSDKLESIS